MATQSPEATRPSQKELEEVTRQRLLKSITPGSFAQQLYTEYLRFTPEKHYFGAFLDLYNANLLYLQAKLAKLKRKITENQKIDEDSAARLKGTLREYSQAIQDFEYISKLSKPSAENIQAAKLSLESAFRESEASGGFSVDYATFSDPHIETRRTFIREILRKNLPRNLAWSMKERREHQGEYWNNEIPKDYSRWTNGFARISVAFIAAAWLIVPIIIMTVPDTSKWKILGVLIGATSLFGLSLAVFGTSFKDQEILAATAAYAAVLVVFYGNVTNIPGAGTQQVSAGNSTTRA